MRNARATFGVTLRRSCLGLLVIPLAGCTATTSLDGYSEGGGGTMGAGGSDGGDDDACATLADAFCARVAACNLFALQMTFPDLATCRVRMNIACDLLVSAPGSGLTNANMLTCAEKLPTVSCDDWGLGLGWLGEGHMQSACGNIVGSLENGSGCTYDLQCSSGYCQPGEGSCGECVSKVSVGQACEAKRDCLPGLACSDQVCVVEGSLGDPCDWDRPCGGLLQCPDRDNGDFCTALLQNGEDCDPLQSPSCDHSIGLYCDPISTYCQMMMTAAPGQSCEPVGSTPTFCQGGSMCMHSCVGPAPDGEICGAPTLGECLQPARCVDQMCAFPDPSTCL